MSTATLAAEPTVVRQAPLPPESARVGGFTLIEVTAALVIFSVGVLMAVQLTGVLSIQLERAATRSEIVVAVQGRLDALSVLPYDSLVPGTEVDTLEVRGRPFVSTVRIIQFKPRIRELAVSMAPSSSPGPRYAAQIYANAPW